MRRLLLVMFLLVFMPLAGWAAGLVLLRVDNQNPYASPLQKLVAIPDFVLQSDGTVFYDRTATEVGQVEYYTAHMSEDEMSTVVSRLQLGGASDWEESYENATLEGLPTTVFAISAPSLKRTISVYGASWSAREHQIPDALGWLYDYVSNYHNSTERLFVPSHATLYVKHLFGTTNGKDTEHLEVKWTPRIDLTKATATGGSGEYKSMELDGKQAEDAWSALHDLALPTMLAPKVVFTHKKDLYQLGIKPQIPGI